MTFEEDPQDSAELKKSVVEKLKEIESKMAVFHEDAEASMAFMDGEFRSKVESLKDRVSRLDKETQSFLKSMENDLQNRLNLLKIQVKASSEKIQVKPEKVKEDFDSEIHDIRNHLQSFSFQDFQLKKDLSKTQQDFQTRMQEVADQIESLHQGMREKEQRFASKVEIDFSRFSKQLGEMRKSLEEVNTNTADSFDVLQGELRSKMEFLQKRVDGIETLSPRMDMTDRRLEEVGRSLDVLVETQRQSLETFQEQLRRDALDLQAKQKDIEEKLQSQSTLDQEAGRNKVFLENAMHEKISGFEAQVQKLKETNEQALRSLRFEADSRFGEIEKKLDAFLAEKIRKTDRRVQQIYEEIKGSLASADQTFRLRVEELRGGIETASSKSDQFIASVQDTVGRQIQGIEESLQEVRSRSVKTGERITAEVQEQISRIVEEAARLENQIGQMKIQFGSLEEKTKAEGKNWEVRAGELDSKMEGTLAHFRQDLKAEIGEVWNRMTGLEEHSRNSLSQVQEGIGIKLRFMEEKVESWSHASKTSLESVGSEFRSQLQVLDTKSTEWIQSVRLDLDSVAVRLTERMDLKDQEGLNRIAVLDTKIKEQIPQLEHRFQDWYTHLTERFEALTESTQNTAIAFESEIKHQLGLFHKEIEKYALHAEDTVHAAETRFREDFQRFSGLFEERITFVRDEMQFLLESLEHKESLQFGEIYRSLRQMEEAAKSKSREVDIEIGKLDRKLEENHNLSTHFHYQLHDLEKRQRHLSDEFAVLGNQIQNEADKTFEAIESQIEDRVLAFNRKVDQTRMDLDREFDRIVTGLETQWQGIAEDQDRSWKDLREDFQVQLKTVHGSVQQTMSRKLVLGLLGVGLVSGVAVGGVGMVWIQQEINRRFETPAVEKTLHQAAQEQVPRLMEREASPVLNELKGQAQGELETFQAFMRKEKNKYQVAYEEAIEKIDFFEKRNSLSRLADEAMVTANRDAYEELVRYYQTAEEDDLKLAAFSEIAKIKAYFRNERILKDTGTFPFERGQLRDRNLYDILVQTLITDHDWKARARAAQLLGSWNDSRVPDLLLQAARSDKNLHVVHYALQSFRRLTQYDHPDLFALNETVSWWQANRSSVIKQLEAASF